MALGRLRVYASDMRAVLLLALALTMTIELKDDIAGRLLEDEEIWSVGAGRIDDSTAAVFVKRAEAAAAAIAGHAEALPEAEREGYVASMLGGEQGVRERLKGEILEAARTGKLPTAPLVEAAPWRPPSVTAWTPQQVILGLIAGAALVVAGFLLVSRRR